MTYELCKKLKDARFPQSEEWAMKDNGSDLYYEQPTLEELIEACGEQFFDLRRKNDGWQATAQVKLDKPDEVGDDYMLPFVEGTTPTIAVAKLWLELNKKG